MMTALDVAFLFKSKILRGQVFYRKKSKSVAKVILFFGGNLQQE